MEAAKLLRAVESAYSSKGETSHEGNENKIIVQQFDFAIQLIENINSVISKIGNSIDPAIQMESKLLDEVVTLEVVRNSFQAGAAFGARKPGDPLATDHPIEIF